MSTESLIAEPTATQPQVAALHSSQPNARSARPGALSIATELLTITLALALLCGTVETSYWMYLRLVQHQIIFLPTGISWITPAAYVAMFLLVVAPLAVFTVIRKSRIGVAAAVGISAFLAVVSLLQLCGQINALSQVVLAAGCASLVTRWNTRQPQVARRWARSSVAWSLGCVLFLVAVERATMLEATQSPANAAMPATRKPNVLLIVLDTVRADALGIYGGSTSATPNIDRYAKQGIVFQNATTTAPWTLPSIASVLTGRLPHELSTGWRSGLDKTHPTVAEVFANQGYRTGAFVANNYCARYSGLERGFGHFDDYELSPAMFVRCTALGRALLISEVPLRLGLHWEAGRRSAKRINERFLNWLHGADSRPFFAFINYFDAHDPYWPLPPFDERKPHGFEQRRLVQFWWWLEKDGVSADDRDFLWQAYGNCVRYLDEQVGQLLDALDAQGMLEDTIVVITSDHGEHFGDHGIYLHGNSLYEAAIHAPLVIIPTGGAQQPQSVKTPVSLQHLPATLTNMAEVFNHGMPGRSLAELWNDNSSAGDPAAWPAISQIPEPCFLPPCQGHSPVFDGPMWAVRRGDFKYIRTGNAEELYNLSVDPGETKNLIESPEHRHIRHELARLLRQACHTSSPD